MVLKSYSTSSAWTRWIRKWTWPVVRSREGTMPKRRRRSSPRWNLIRTPRQAYDPFWRTQANSAWRICIATRTLEIRWSTVTPSRILLKLRKRNRAASTTKWSETTTFTSKICLMLTKRELKWCRQISSQNDSQVLCFLTINETTRWYP